MRNHLPLPSRARSSDIRRWSAWMALTLVAFHTLGGVHFRIGDGATSRVAAGDAEANLLQYALIIGILSCIILGFVLEKSLPRENIHWLVWLVFSWCFLSAIWSISPAVTVRRTVLLFITSYAIFYAVSCIRPKKAIECVLTATLIVTAADYTFVLLNIGIHSSSDLGGALAGDWRGIHAHKNTAGALYGSLVVFAFLLLMGGFRKRGLLLLIASAVFLVYANSKTAIVAAPIAILIAAVTSMLVRKMGVPLAIIIFSVPIIPIIVFLHDADLEIQSETFTGRGEVWLILINYVRENAIFGAGFGSFWNIGFESPIYGLTRSWVSTLTEGHNGYLDLALTIGIPGVCLVVIAFYIVPLIKLIPQLKEEHGPIWMGLIVYSLINNVTESSLLASDAPSWFFLVFSVAILSLQKCSRSGQTSPFKEEPNRVLPKWRPTQVL